jgi:hypothetical protein
MGCGVVEGILLVGLANMERIKVREFIRYDLYERDLMPKKQFWEKLALLASFRA